MNTDLKILCDYFDHCYVLTIPRAKERQENFNKQFEGCRFEFLMGMDAKNETRERLIKAGIYDEKKAKKIDSHCRPLALGDIACSWGQAKIYRSVLHNNYKNALIFEDDVVVDEDAMKHLDDMLLNIPKDADLIYWGWERSVVRGKFFWLKNFYHHMKLAAARLFPGRNGFSLFCFSVVDHQMVNNIYARPYNKQFMIAGAHYCTHAYSVTAKCCEILLKMQTPIAYVADHLLIHAILHKKIKAYIATPKLFVQDSHTVNSVLPQYTER